MWVPVASKAGEKHIYPEQPETRPMFHHAIVVTQQCVL